MMDNILRTGSQVIYNPDLMAFYGQFEDLQKQERPVPETIIVEHSGTGKTIEFKHWKTTVSLDQSKELAEVYINEELEVKVVLFKINL
jgi:hypothetical protein